MNSLGNRIINDIMSNNSPSVMVLSNSDSMNTVFLRELSNRYSVTFWFDARQDDVSSFSLDLAEKLILDEPELLKKFVQLKYTENEGVDKVIIGSVMDYVAKIAGDCLLVMENLEKIHRKFKYELMEYLLLNCPKNLKIILISEIILPLDYNKLGKFAPKIIDEFVLSEQCMDCISLKTDDLTKEDVEFIYYISDLYSVNSDFVNQIYKNGCAVLDYISVSNMGLVLKKGANKYEISKKLKGLVFESTKSCGSFSDLGNVFVKLFNYLLDNGKYLNALKIAIKLVDVNLFDEAMEKIVCNCDYAIRLFAFAASEKSEVMEKFITIDNRRLYEYSAVYDFENHRYESCIEKTDRILSIQDLTDFEYMITLYIKIKAINKLYDANAAVEYARTILPKEYLFSDIKKYELIITYLPKLMRDSDYEYNKKALNNCTKILEKNQLPCDCLYIKALQAISEAYFDIGNCRKAQEYLQSIYEKIDFYVVPYNFLQYFYFAGDMSKAEMIAEKTLKNAEKFGENRNISYIYSLLARINSYSGNISEAIKNSDSAVEAKNSTEAAKYHAVWVKTVTYANFSKEEYPKDIALIYAKICEKKNSKFAANLYACVSYWYWQKGFKEEAKHYAGKCLLKTKNHTLIWVMASSVLINYAIFYNDIKGMDEILDNFLKACQNNALDTIFVDYKQFFAPIIKYAKQHEINSDYITKLEKSYNDSFYKANADNKTIKVKIFGEASIKVNGKEVQWKTKKSRELFLLYLVKSTSGIDRNGIFSLLWGSYIYESAINNLKTTNNIIRKTLDKYNISYKLEYKNGKYTMYLPSVDFDYSKFNDLIGKFEGKNSMAEKITVMLDIVNLYGIGFAPEYANDEFNGIRTDLKNLVAIKLVEFVKLLREKHRFIDAKKFIIALSKIDENLYKEMMTEQN